MAAVHPSEPVAVPFISEPSCPRRADRWPALTLPQLERHLLAAADTLRGKMEAGRFKMRRDVASQERAAMIRWYSARAQPWLTARVARYAGRARVEPRAVTVQDLELI